MTSGMARDRNGGRFVAGAPEVRVVGVDGAELHVARAGWSHF